MSYITGTGSYLPGEKPVTNEMLAEIFGEPVMTIGDFFGIQSRSFVVDYHTGENVVNEFNSDFCVKAVQKALKNSGKTSKDIGLLISATNTPDYSLPQTSALIQERLEIENLITMDLRGGCSVPLQGLLIADTFIKCGIVENAIIVGSECFSPVFYPLLLKNREHYLAKDLLNSLIFGDGAAALVVSKNIGGNNPLTIERVVSQSSFPLLPSGLVVGFYGSRVKQLGQAEVSLGKLIKHSSKIIDLHLTKVMEALLNKIYSETGCRAQEFRYMIGPQANKRLLDTLDPVLKGTNHYYYGDITGNIPGAALILALDKLLCEGLIRAKDKVCVWGIESSKWIYGYSILTKV